MADDDGDSTIEAQTPTAAQPGANDPYTNDPRLSPLEADVLREYRTLRENLNKVRSPCEAVSATQSCW